MPWPSSGSARAQGGLSPALPAAGPAQPQQQQQQQQELAFTGARGLCCGFISWGIFVGNWFCFLEYRQHEEGEDEEDEETHPASILIWNQKLWDVVWVSDGISPPGATVGVLPPPWTHSRVRHSAGDVVPKCLQALQDFPPSGVCPNSGHGEDQSPLLPVLNYLLLFRQKLKAKKINPKPKPAPSICHTRNQPRAHGWGF